TFSSPLIERLGARRTGFITVLGSTACYSSITLITWAPLAFFVLFIAGILAGSLEINLNVQIGRLEALTGRSLMSRAHGFWSLGFFVTSLVAAGIRQAEIPAPWHLTGVFIFVVIVAFATLWGLVDAPVPPSHGDQKPPLIAF